MLAVKYSALQMFYFGSSRYKHLGHHISRLNKVSMHAMLNHRNPFTQYAVSKLICIHYFPWMSFVSWCFMLQVHGHLMLHFLKFDTWVIKSTACILSPLIRRCVLRCDSIWELTTDYSFAQL